MRSSAFLLLIISFALTSFGQESTPTPNRASDVNSSALSELDKERDAFKNAIAEKKASRRVSYLKDFVAEYPDSEQKHRALGLIVSGRAEIADIKLRDGKILESVRLFELAVKEAPEPISDRLYRSIILQIPNNLFFRGERVGGIKLAKMIENKVANNPKQLIALTTFYLGVENASEAIRVAKRVIRLDPNTKGVYQVLGLAHRFNFNLERSAEAYRKALETNPNSIAAKISLADMYRANGRANQAIELYSEVVENNPKLINAQTGLVLSLFDAGRLQEAELKLELVLIEEPNNLFLLVGAAYWYAANGDGEKAITYSQKALTIEPKYTWGYIALARGHMKMGDPISAEKVLFTAKKFGNFPTLQYEIASSRLAAGYYKDAAEELKKSFVLEDGVIKTKLGGRVSVRGMNFIELLSLERKASIFQPNSANDKKNDDRLKKLLAFSNTITDKSDDTKILASANEFIDGDDKMKTYRQIFVADRLLEEKRAIPKVLEITKDAVKGIENALATASPSSAILADELYRVRSIAFARGEMLDTPKLDNATLESILRGRIEQISGSAFHLQKENQKAVVRLKRAISVYPKDSVWLRSTNWRMGLILQEQNKDKDALGYLIKGYSVEEKDLAKKAIIENAYKSVYGTLDGFDEKLKSKPTDEKPDSIFVKKSEKTDETNEARNEDLANRNIQADEESTNSKPSDSDKTKETQNNAKDADSTISGKLSENNKTNPMDNIAVENRSNRQKPADSDRKTIGKTSKERAISNDLKKPIVVVQDTLSNTERIVGAKNKTTRSRENSGDKTKVGEEENLGERPATKTNQNSNKQTTKRPRIFTNQPNKTPESEAQTCKIFIDYQSVSIINNGEEFSVLVGTEEKRDHLNIMAFSSHPKDVVVTFEPEIGANQGRAFFVIKSISSNRGEYKVTFKTPCGTKEVPVKVR